MVAMDNIIETGVDKLVALIKKKGRVSIPEAAKDLGVSTDVIEDWVDFLEEESIIAIEYKFTTPFLVEKKVTKDEIKTKEREFKTKKDIFIRKSEGSLAYLEKEAESLKEAKDEFDTLKKELGIEVDSVKKELAELEKYDAIRKNLDVEISKQRKDMLERFGDMNSQIVRERKRYEDLLKDIYSEEEKLEEEKLHTLGMKELEKSMEKKIESLKATAKSLEIKMKVDDSALANSEMHIKNLKLLADDIKAKVKADKDQLSLMLQKNKEHEKKVLELQESMFRKLKAAKVSKAPKADVYKKFRDFFDKKMKTSELISKVNKDRDDLERELKELIRKAKAFQLSSRKGDVNKQVKELEKKLEEVTNKKNTFEKELKEVHNILGKK